MDNKLIPLGEDVGYGIINCFVIVSKNQELFSCVEGDLKHLFGNRKFRDMSGPISNDQRKE